MGCSHSDLRKGKDFAILKLPIEAAMVWSRPHSSVRSRLSNSKLRCSFFTGGLCSWKEELGALCLTLCKVFHRLSCLFQTKSLLCTQLFTAESFALAVPLASFPAKKAAKLHKVASDGGRTLCSWRPCLSAQIRNLAVYCIFLWSVFWETAAFIMDIVSLLNMSASR